MNFSFLKNSSFCKIKKKNANSFTKRNKSEQKMEKTKQIFGVFPPIPTLFQEDGNLNLLQMKKNAAHLLQKCPELSGLVVLGSNGEYVSLDKTEKIQIFESIRSAVPKSNQHLLIAGCGMNSSKETIETTNLAAKSGFDFALIITPYYFKAQLSDNALLQHYLKVAEESKIPLLIYNVPVFTGVDLSDNVIEQLSKHPNIVGIKENSGNIVKLASVVAKTKTRSNFSVLAGSGSYFLPSLTVGSSGGIMALANVVPQTCCQMFSLFKQQEANPSAEVAKQLQELQHATLPLNQAVTKEFGVAGLKYAMSKMGYENVGFPRLPLLPLTHQQEEKIDQILQKIRLLKILV
jgi:4-hydroxy-2-oxoglutarate aldolase